MSNLIHYQGSEAQDAMSVIAKWMSQDYNLTVNFHNGTDVSADIFKKIINIPKLACSSGLTDEALMLLRGRTYHEVGHIVETVLEKADYPAGVLFQILNAVEDRRMEMEQSKKYPGAKLVFGKNSRYYNQKISGDVADGKVNAPLWEGLVAMSFQSEGQSPKWRLSEKAQAYFDAGYDKFVEWKGLKDAYGSLELAKELYDILKEAHEESKKEQDEGQGDEQGEGQGEGQSGDEHGEPQEGEEQTSTGNPMDFDNEDDEKGSNESKGQAEEEGEEAESEEGAEDNEDGEESQKGASQGKSEEDGDDDSQGEEEGDSSAGSATEEADDAEATEGKSSEDKDEKGSKDYNTDYNEEHGGKTQESNFEEEMSEELEGGKGLDEYQNEDIEKSLQELDPEDKKYLSRRDLDEHRIIEGDDRYKDRFKQDRAAVAAAVAGMVRALEQSMRARTRCRTNRFQRAGKIDKTRLTQIAKSLSKEVFYKTKKGEELETAVEIVIDESGSMGGAECVAVRRVAIAVSESLAQLKIPFEVTGSTTKYGCGSGAIQPLNGLSRTNPLIYNHYKTFSQQWMNVRHNISQSGARLHNVDGEVVEYATRRLLERPEARKIVLTLSDGMPDAGHGNGTLMGKNIIRTCERARQAGVEVYAFGIGTNAPANYYGRDNFVELPTGEELGPTFAAEFVSIVSGGRFKVGKRK